MGFVNFLSDFFAFCKYNMNFFTIRFVVERIMIFGKRYSD